MAERTHFQASTNDGNSAVLIKAAGPCSMSCCVSLKQFVGQFKKPETSELYIDLSDAESIDSTFAGFMLSLATKKSDPKAPDLFLVSPSERIMEAIRTMHIGGFFNVCDTLPPSTAGWQEVAVERESCDALRETVIESHEQLIDADERNEEEFGRVVEGFRADRQQSKRGHDQP